MAPQPASTNIFYVDYAGLMGTRSFQFRYASGVNVATVVAAMETWLVNDVADLWHTSVTVTGFRNKLQGSTVSLPIPQTQSISGTNVSAYNGDQFPKFLSLSARGVSSGAELRLYLYGCIFSTPADYRAEDGEFPLIDNIRVGWATLINTAGGVTWLGDGVVLRDYVNVGFNSYYERKRRQEA